MENWKIGYSKSLKQKPNLYYIKIEMEKEQKLTLEVKSSSMTLMDSEPIEIEDLDKHSTSTSINS